jgi:hypothetical protein
MSARPVQVQIRLAILDDFQREVSSTFAQIDQSTCSRMSLR